jgi:hypothetical protein
MKYELQYIKWYGISFDRDKLIKFIRRIKLTKFLSFIPSYRLEHKILNEILQSQDQTRINGLLNNDEDISRMCLIEKWARIASVDILLNGIYSRSTYTTITNLPIKDYQLLMKRVEEIVEVGKNMTYQTNNITDNTPGL